MPTSLQAKFVKCPFYESDDKGRISCEGITDESRIRLCFMKASGALDQDKKLEYLHNYCIRDYQKCRVYKMLQAKYEGK